LLPRAPGEISRPPGAGKDGGGSAAGATGSHLETSEKYTRYTAVS